MKWIYISKGPTKTRMISKREGWERSDIFLLQKGEIYIVVLPCGRAVPGTIHTPCTHVEATVTATAVEREEEEEESVVLPFVSFPPDNIYFISPDTQYR